MKYNPASQPKEHMIVPTPIVPPWVSRPDQEVYAEQIKLWLPSSVPAEHRTRVCLQDVAKIEEKFRTAHMEDSLVLVRKGLRLFSVQRSRYKGEMSSGVKASTRARNEINSYLTKANAAATRYRTARAARLNLNPTGSWQSTFRVLNSSDLRGPYNNDHTGDLPATRHVRERRVGGGHQETSWIWLATISGDDMTEQMRVQWSTLSAYADRFAEELLLLPEEMRRCLAYFEWEAKQWDDRRNARVVTNRPLLSLALHAYASQQADIRRLCVRHFAQTWLPILFENPQLEHKWTILYANEIDASILQKRLNTLRRRKKDGVSPL
jgi:hypothetical protein